MTPDLTDKDFATMRAQAALLGYCLMRTDPANGPVVFLLESDCLAQTNQPEQLLEMFSPVQEAEHSHPKEDLHGNCR